MRIQLRLSLRAHNQGKPELDTHDENCTAGRLEGRERKTQGIHCFERNASSDFTGNTIVKLERGLVGT